MIGVLINGLMLIAWLLLWGIGVMTLAQVAPAICISIVGLAICALMDALA